jgi:hypothetical protein
MGNVMKHLSHQTKLKLFAMHICRTRCKYTSTILKKKVSHAVIHTFLITDGTKMHHVQVVYYRWWPRYTDFLVPFTSFLGHCPVREFVDKRSILQIYHHTTGATPCCSFCNFPLFSFKCFGFLNLLDYSFLSG